MGFYSYISKSFKFSLFIFVINLIFLQQLRLNAKISNKNCYLSSIFYYKIIFLCSWNLYGFSVMTVSINLLYVVYLSRYQQIQNSKWNSVFLGFFEKGHKIEPREKVYRYPLIYVNHMSYVIKKTFFFN